MYVIASDLRQSVFILIYIIVKANFTLSVQQSFCPKVCICQYKGGDIVSADCSNHNLQTVPGNLPNTLQNLNLSNNSISEIRTEELQNFSELQALNLQGNHLTKLESNVFAHLLRLQSLDVSDNYLKELHSDSFRNLTSLTSLNLRNNSLLYISAYFPDSVFEDLFNLIELNLKDNSKPDLINSSFCYPDGALSKLISLEKLHLDGMPNPCMMGTGFRNLTRLKLLNFGNPIRHMCLIGALPESFFFNLRTCEDLEIDLLNCNIQSVHPQTFAKVPSLNSLILAGNHYFNFDQFINASTSFNLTRLKKLDISQIKKRYLFNLTAACLKNLQTTSLETLIMRSNGFLNIARDVPVHLPRTLKSLDISNNNLMKGDIFHSWFLMISLEIINASVQNSFTSKYMINNEFITKQLNHSDKMLRSHGFYFPLLKLLPNSELDQLNNIDKKVENIIFLNTKNVYHRDQITIGQWIQFTSEFCPNYFQEIFISKHMYNKTIMFSKPAWLDYMWNSSSHDRNQIMSKHTFANNKPFLLPPNLRQFHGSEMKLGFAIPKIIFIGNNVLEYFNISLNLLWCFGGPFFGMSSVKVMDLSKNYAIALNPLFFSDMYHLKWLSLGYNSIGASLGLDISGKTFSNLANLEYLDLSFSDLHELSSEAFINNNQLKRLILHNNALYKFTPQLSQLSHLEFIDLSHNALPGLSDMNMKELDDLKKKSHNITVNLLYNPLICNCASLAFLLWYQKTPVTFTQRELYRCQFMNGSSILMQHLDEPLKILWRTCHGQSFLLLSVILFSLMIISLTAAAMFSYYQYTLYYYVYISKQRFFFHLRDNEQRRMQDVYLVFDDQDIRWRHHVLDVLLPSLSSGGITYHVSEVGAQEPSAGRPIWEVIEESILFGRKTLVLLTEDIFLDEEHQLAVNMARIVQDMTGCKTLLFLIAEKLNAGALPVHLYRLLRSSRIIRYTPDRAQFWTKLIDEIKS